MMFSFSDFTAYSRLDARRRLELGLGVERLILLNAAHRRGDVGQHELVRRRRREEVHARVREVHRVALLVEHEEQVFLDVAELLLGRRLLAVGDVRELLLQDQLLDAGLLHHLQQALVLGAAHPRLVEAERGRVLVAGGEGLLALGDEIVRELRLAAHQPRDGAVVLAYCLSPSLPTGPEMISGVRASSMSTESTSSTMA
jgi:hypothetical protein